MRRKDVPLTLAAAAGLLLVTACSADPPAGRPADPAKSVAGELRTELTDTEKELLGTAEQRLIAACMKDKGFRYTLDPAPAEARSEMPDRPFGLDDVAWARAHGYGLAETAGTGDRAGGKARAETGPQARYLAALTPQRRTEFTRALDGTDRGSIVVDVPGRGQVFTSADGCQADARRQLYGDLRRWTEAKAIIVNLEYITWDQVVAKPEYTKALANWRTCMSDRGLPYRSSSEAIEAVAAQRRSESPGAARTREVRVAVADAECNRRETLARTGTRIQREQVEAAASKRFARQARHFTDAVAGALAKAESLTRPA
ncbi:hypothetical protein [Streptomyces sp. SYSU K21746]